MDPVALLLELGKGFLIALATILPILNPAGSAPIFLALTEGAATATRAVLARRIGRNTALLLIGAMLIGSYVLDIFGISLPIVRVAGGLLIARNAWRLLNATAATNTRQEMAANFTPDQARKQAFYPLTFPITCGPGSISAAITIGVTLHDAKLATTLARTTGGVLSVLVIGIVVFLVLRYAQQFLKPLGETGTTVFVRLSAFILLCVGVQIVWDGLSELILSLK